MNQHGVKTGEISLWTVLLITLVMIAVLLIVLLPAILPHDHSSGYRIQASLNQKELSACTSIYQTDFDDLYPPASGMSAISVVLEPYAQNNKLFKAFEHISTVPRFNFNLAGVNAVLPPYPSALEQNPDEVAMWSSQLLGKKHQWIISFADTGTKRIDAQDFDKVVAAFEGQFDRKGVKLWPADYLAAQDPLK